MKYYLYKLYDFFNLNPIKLKNFNWKKVIIVIVVFGTIGSIFSLVYKSTYIYVSSISADEFKIKIEEINFSVEDTTESTDYSNINKTFSITTDELTFIFYEFKDFSSARLCFYDLRKKASEKAINNGNITNTTKGEGTYMIETSEGWNYVYREIRNNTVVFSYCEKSNKMELEKILNAIGYGID